MPKFLTTSPFTPSEALMNVKQVAAYLGKSQRTIERWVGIRYIDHIAFGPGERKSVRFRQRDIDQWLLKQSSTNGNRVCEGRTSIMPSSPEATQ
jgi:excisionase family DNA binding protein